jgi:hypothetical protein
MCTYLRIALACWLLAAGADSAWGRGFGGYSTAAGGYGGLARRGFDLGGPTSYYRPYIGAGLTPAERGERSTSDRGTVGYRGGTFSSAAGGTDALAKRGFDTRAPTSYYRAYIGAGLSAAERGDMSGADAGYFGGYRGGGDSTSSGRFGSLGRRGFDAGGQSRLLNLPTDAGLTSLDHDQRTHSEAKPSNGAAAAASGARAFHLRSPAQNRAQAWAVRSHFPGYGWFGRDWPDRCPGCWWPAGWYQPKLAGGAWSWCTWSVLGPWLGYADTAPIFYNYGDNLIYDGGQVYYQGKLLGSTADDYAQMSKQAGSGPEPAAGATDWLPLGVFGLARIGQPESSLVFQLAVDKAGTLRGNCSQPDETFVGTVAGAVEKERQRVAWTVGDDKQTVYETGLYNLTKDEAPALVHRGADKTEQWLLVRIKQPE